MVAIVWVEIKAILAILVATSLPSLQPLSSGRRTQRNPRASKLRELLKLYHVTQHLSELDWGRAFRMRRSAFSNLLQLLYPELNRGESRVASSCARFVHTDKSRTNTLLFLGTGSYHDILMFFQVAQSTTYAIFHATVLELNRKLKMYGLPINNLEKLQTWARGF